MTTPSTIRRVGTDAARSETTTPKAARKPSEHCHVVIIGAGLSGLAAARELAQRNIAVTLLDARKRIAEPWRARHPQLRLNIHHRFTALPGRAMTRRDGTFVRRDTVVAYLEDYAKHLNLPIHFGAEVTTIERCGAGWRVSTAGHDYGCAHVVIATGRDRVPHIPAWPARDDFTGELLHAADLGEVARFDGKHVLVIGAGNSGADALNHLARHAPAEVQISVRHGPAVVPNRIFGFPLHRLAPVFAALPATLLDPAFRLTQRLFLGDLTRHGLKSHPDGGGTRLLRDGIAFAIDDGFVAAIRQGRFRVVAEVSRFDRNQVVLSDRTVCTPDVVICATGYRSGLEALVGRFGVLDANGQPTRPMGEADPAHRGLWFTGFRPIFTGYFDAAGIAARRIAARIATDPSRQARNTRPTGSAGSGVAA